MGTPQTSPAPWRRWVVMLATLVGIALTARLGLWQLDRAAQKESLQRTLDARHLLAPLPAEALARNDTELQAQQYRTVRVTGRWLGTHAIYLDNRQMDGRPGFFVVVPLQLEPGGRTVLVQRGWIPRAFDERTRLPPLQLGEGLVTVSAQIAPPPGRLYEFAVAASGPIRQNLDLAAFSLEIGQPLAPLTLVEDATSPAAAGDGLSRRWPAPSLGIQKHYGYAFQWFALCALMAILYVWFRILRPRLGRA